MIDDVRALRRALLLMVWGVLLTFLDLRVDRVDLVPDALGWVLMAVALGQASRLVHDDTYRGLMVAACVLTVVPFAVSLAALAVDVGGLMGFAAGLVADVVLGLAALALSRVARFAGAGHLRYLWVWWGSVLGTAYAVTGLAVASQDGATAVVAALFSVTAFVLYLVALLRTRAALPAY